MKVLQNPFRSIKILTACLDLLKNTLSTMDNETGKRIDFINRRAAISQSSPALEPVNVLIAIDLCELMVI